MIEMNGNFKTHQGSCIKLLCKKKQEMCDLQIYLKQVPMLLRWRRPLWNRHRILFFLHHETSANQDQMETYAELLALCAGKPPITREFPSKGRWPGASMFSLICVCSNGWVNNRRWFETPSRSLWRHGNAWGVRRGEWRRWRDGIKSLSGDQWISLTYLDCDCYLTNPPCLIVDFCSRLTLDIHQSNVPCNPSRIAQGSTPYHTVG